MQFELRVQDPTDPPNSALIDVIVGLMSEGEVVGGRWLFGFLTGSGMNALLAIPSIAAVLHRAAIEAVVGLDAVTDRAGLQRLLDVQAINSAFSASVIKNTTGVLVHPKMLTFDYDDDRRAVVVGSNNLSGNGLSGNVEGYTIVRFEPGEPCDLSDWDRFLDRWQPMLSPIDFEAMEMAKSNEQRARVAAPRAGRPSVAVTDGISHETIPSEAEPQEHMLVAELTRASNRWSQVHFSQQVMTNFFGVGVGGVVELREFGGTSVTPQPVVYSQRNKNYKLELDAAARLIRAGVAYPAVGRPIAVYRREGAGAHRFRYALLMPGERGHQELTDLANAEWTPIGNQVPRVIVPRSKVLAAWPGCPV